MTLQQQIWRSKDADLQRDLAKYQEAIEANQMPEMMPHWKQAVAMIEHEIDQRHLLASSATRWAPVVLENSEVPF